MNQLFEGEEGCMYVAKMTGCRKMWFLAVFVSVPKNFGEYCTLYSFAGNNHIGNCSYWCFVHIYGNPVFCIKKQNIECSIR